MGNIKTELNNLIDEIRVAEFFERIDNLKTAGEIEIKDIPSLKRLRDEYIFGNVSFDYYNRLRAWISINIVIVFNPQSGRIDTKLNGFCQEIKDLISKGKLDKAIAKLLEVLQGKDEHSDTILLSGQYI